MQVDLITDEYSDLTVVNAARVSFAKHVTEFTDRDSKLLTYLATHGHWSPFAHPQLVLHIRGMSPGELLNLYLNANMHGFSVVPYKGGYTMRGSLYGWFNALPYFDGRFVEPICDFCNRAYPHSYEALTRSVAGRGTPADGTGNVRISAPDRQPWHDVKEVNRLAPDIVANNASLRKLVPITFRVTAPIYVARQLVKHQKDLVWNEVSRRYVDDLPEYYRPDVWRGRPVNAKQGSSEECVDLESFDDEGNEWDKTSFQAAFDRSLADVIYYTDRYTLGLYQAMTKAGVAPELARGELPLKSYTQWYWTGSLDAFDRVLEQRLDPHAQAETRVIAEGIRDGITKMGYSLLC